MKDRSHSVARLLGVVILLAAWVATGGAQTQGGIGGLVTDSSGAAVPGATVTVTNTATQRHAQYHDQRGRALHLPRGASRLL